MCNILLLKYKCGHVKLQTRGRCNGAKKFSRRIKERVEGPNSYLALMKRKNEPLPFFPPPGPTQHHIKSACKKRPLLVLNLPDNDCAVCEHDLWQHSWESSVQKTKELLEYLNKRLSMQKEFLLKQGLDPDLKERHRKVKTSVGDSRAMKALKSAIATHEEDLRDQRDCGIYAKYMEDHKRVQEKIHRIHDDLKRLEEQHQQENWRARALVSEPMVTAARPTDLTRNIAQSSTAAPRPSFSEVREKSLDNMATDPDMTSPQARELIASLFPSLRRVNANIDHFPVSRLHGTPLRRSDHTWAVHRPEHRLKPSGLRNEIPLPTEPEVEREEKTPDPDAELAADWAAMTMEQYDGDYEASSDPIHPVLPVYDDLM